jgi:hypothetical protein
MKKLGFMLLLVLMLGIASGTALAQSAPNQGPVGNGSVYFVTYYSNAGGPCVPTAQTNGGVAAPDAVVRFINDGDTGSDLWADYYVFDDSQELQECCSCDITADGINSEDLNNNLLGNVLTGKATTKGVIKVIASSSNDATNPKPTAGLRGFATHIQRANPAANGGGGAYFVTEAPFANANLASGEQSYLGLLCKFAVILGSGRGTCSCTPEDYDF